MKLFHAFPRPEHKTNSAGSVVRNPPTDEDRRRGLEILRLILTYGLLCTPERFMLYPNYGTDNEEKRKYLEQGKPHDEIIQSRACFTLVNSLDLSKEYELSQNGQIRYSTHTDLFGEFAIGLDPVEAREIGVMPTVYYYRHNVRRSFETIAGLGGQIVERLDEIRNVFSILSHIEAIPHQGTEREELHPPPHELKRRGIKIRYESDIEAELAKIKAEEAALIFRLFDSDRIPAWNMVDFIHIMLSLYQTTDSTIEDAPLAFFQQREWRLVLHMMEGLKWFSLGSHPENRDLWANDFKSARKEIRKFVLKDYLYKKRSRSRCLTRKDKKYLTWFFNNSWVLAGTYYRHFSDPEKRGLLYIKNQHFRNFVREIVVPENSYKEAKAIIDSLRFDSGQTPLITPLPSRWRIAIENGIPKIIRPGDS
jgi:hypothetical protein